MNYEEAKIIKEQLYAEVDAASHVLSKFPKGPWGLTPDDVKRSPEFVNAARTFNSAFAKSRKFNQFFNKAFKAEYRAERLSKGYRK